MNRSAAFILVMAGMLPGCAPARPALETYHRLDAPVATRGADAPKLDTEAYADLLGDLRSGDMVLAVREDPITPLVRLVTTEPSYFTHSAIVEVAEFNSIDDGRNEARVWHAIGDFNLFNLTPHILGKVRGGVRSLELEELIRMYDVLFVLRLSDDSKNHEMVEVCKRLQRDGVPFDSFLDCADDSALFCTELNVVTMRQAGYGEPVQPAPRTHVATLSTWMTEWNITAPAIYMASQFEDLPGAEVVAVISRYGRMETYLAMHDAATLIHEKINAERIVLSDLCGFDRDRLVHYTDRMELFLRGVEGLAKASPTSEAAEIRRRNEVVFAAVFEGTR